MSAKKGQINDFDLEDDLEEIEEKSNSSNDLKQTIIKMMVIIGGGILLLILILAISSMFTKKTYSYEQIETIMENAAKEYLNENPDALKIAETKTVEVPVANLVASGKMYDLAEYVAPGVSCTGSVTVVKANQQFIYTANLNCGDSYSSVPLYAKILQDSPITKSGYGLYSMNGEKVFRGENVNNYVKLEKALWRIVKIDSDNGVVLIKDTQIGFTAAWDNRYNQNIGYNVGINEYSSSRIKEYLEEKYNTTKEDEIFLSANDKAKLASLDLCVGSRATNSKTNSNGIECKTKLHNQKIGLLTVSDYINASIDVNCQTAENKSCQNYNYLVKNFNWWLTTPVTNTTDRAYSVNTKGEINASPTADYYNVRPVIKLNSTVAITGGTGTESDPYILK